MQHEQTARVVYISNKNSNSFYIVIVVLLKMRARNNNINYDNNVKIFALSDLLSFTLVRQMS